MASDTSALTGLEPGDDLSTTLGGWNAMIRRARLTDEQKLMCLLVSSYADNNGRNVHCGIATLAVDSGKAYSTARRYMAWMRRVGLIEMVRQGNRRAGLSDVYRLILSPTLGDRIHVMDPEEYREAKEMVKADNRQGSATRTHKAKHSADDLRSPEPVDNSDLRSSEVDAETTPVDEPSALTLASADTCHLRSLGAPSALTLDEPPPPLYTSPEELTSPKDHRGDIRSDLAVVRAPETGQDPISSSALTPDPPPTPERAPAPKNGAALKSAIQGIGFCVECYANGQTVLASDPVAGSICAHHERAARSVRWNALNADTGSQPVVPTARSAS